MHLFLMATLQPWQPAPIVLGHNTPTSTQEMQLIPVLGPNGTSYLIPFNGKLPISLLPQAGPVTTVDEPAPKTKIKVEEVEEETEQEGPSITVASSQKTSKKKKTQSREDDTEIETHVQPTKKEESQKKAQRKKRRRRNPGNRQGAQMEKSNADPRSVKTSADVLAFEMGDDILEAIKDAFEDMDQSERTKALDLLLEKIPDMKNEEPKFRSVRFVLKHGTPLQQSHAVGLLFKEFEKCQIQSKGLEALKAAFRKAPAGHKKDILDFILDKSPHLKDKEDQFSGLKFVAENAKDHKRFIAIDRLLDTTIPPRDVDVLRPPVLDALKKLKGNSQGGNRLMKDNPLINEAKRSWQLYSKALKFAFKYGNPLQKRRVIARMLKLVENYQGAVDIYYDGLVFIFDNCDISDISKSQEDLKMAEGQKKEVVRRMIREIPERQNWDLRSNALEWLKQHKSYVRKQNPKDVLHFLKIERDFEPDNKEARELIRQTCSCYRSQGHSLKRLVSDDRNRKEWRLV